jgi:hypothetical protein
MVKNEPLETFGKWQTELYIPPPAKVRAHIVLFYGGFSPPRKVQNKGNSVEITFISINRSHRSTIDIQMLNLFPLLTRTGRSPGTSTETWNSSSPGCYPKEIPRGQNTILKQGLLL